MDIRNSVLFSQNLSAAKETGTWSWSVCPGELGKAMVVQKENESDYWPRWMLYNRGAIHTARGLDPALYITYIIYIMCFCNTGTSACIVCHDWTQRCIMELLERKKKHRSQNTDEFGLWWWWSEKYKLHSLGEYVNSKLSEIEGLGPLPIIGPKSEQKISHLIKNKKIPKSLNR